MLTSFVVWGCARTDLDPSGLEPYEAPLLDAGPDVDADVDVIDAEPDVPDALPDACEPSGPEECNGIDDDCNGQVDDLPPIPCPDGGNRYCVVGKLSECPRRCDTCIPGEERICFVSYCYFWGVQRCMGDGRSFSGCKEESPPPGCEDVARKHHNSPELERCCVEQGYCCLDEHDLDNDGDRRDHVGNCEDVVCTE